MQMLIITKVIIHLSLVRRVLVVPLSGISSSIWKTINWLWMKSHITWSAYPFLGLPYFLLPGDRTRGPLGAATGLVVAP